MERKIKVLVEPPIEEAARKGFPVVEEVIDPEIARFSDWLSKNAGGPLTRLEREVFRAYLYQKLVGIL